ncbi:O-antigen ligase family protein, partial [Leucobacter sp. M11]|uniref:O-antigen ligase family protein n=1 Tax=Leucobacter sp. M11 TaxID=2993565 RepID=UPI002D800FA0
LFFRNALFGLLGKSGDMTGRLEIWQKVIELAEQRPAFGWGWVSYWPFWAEPFNGLDEKVGLPVMHAHNAWLDVWLQLGIVGLVLFAMLAGLTLWRVWFRAIDQPRRDAGAPLPFATSSLVPLLLVVALLVQSLTESRILVEGGWLLLVLLAMKSKTDYQIPSLDAEPRVAPWRDIPLTPARARGERG